MSSVGEPDVIDDDSPGEPTSSTAPPIALSQARRRSFTVIVLVSVVFVATAAVWFFGARHALQQRNLMPSTELSKAAFDWVEMLITIPDDPLTGNAQMEEMKRHTADPLNSWFEDTMGTYFQDYGPWSEQPLQVTSVSLLEAGTITNGHHTDPSSTTVLVTTTARGQLDRGHGFWADVVNGDGQYLIADFGAVV